MKLKHLTKYKPLIYTLSILAIMGFVPFRIDILSFRSATDYPSPQFNLMPDNEAYSALTFKLQAAPYVLLHLHYNHLSTYPPDEDTRTKIHTLFCSFYLPGNGGLESSINLRLPEKIDQLSANGFRSTIANIDIDSRDLFRIHYKDIQPPAITDLLTFCRTNIGTHSASITLESAAKQLTTNLKYEAYYQDHD